ncbi:hypothetical protein ACFQ49_14325 [Kroppenstedtia eburnea]|uniref:Uncharacterized protein n=1 Tax=Kroppenstedtia eburnea TaxID=714067 RepID=A0A1N7NTU4_9BACL|nr:hypothetical protein [Kroppenstedtia eburnea]QKI81153.1 hypothetical protein GXN75_03600 [Kroppenstedtia eburnea]SIT01698.1 hypothetical protein SAMN05421790_11041 [Kroppenstedtia eburnea]
MKAKPIRCIQCYKQRPGGRCSYCPLHKKNRSLYRPVGDGWYERVEEPGPSVEPPTSEQNEQ